MSDERYAIRSTSRVTSRVEDIELAVSPGGRTRKVLRAEIIENASVPENTVKICLVHQKRQTTSSPWADLPGQGLNATTVLTPSKFQLDSQETHELLRHLTALFVVGEEGVRPGQIVVQLANEEEIIRTDAPRAQLINKLLESNHGEEIWKTLVSLEPDLANKLAVAQIHNQRCAVIEEFETALTETHHEQYWNDLLRKNPWMLGNQNVAIVDERRLDINHQSDIPFEVDGGFMDIVELKRPDEPFWTRDRHQQNYKYRGKFLVPHPGLTGAIAQTQGYILQAEKHVSDADFQRTHGVTPLKPRGLVVSGRSVDWGRDEWEAFRLLNDSLHGIQVLTFDHVLEQGKRSVNLTGP